MRYLIISDIHANLTAFDAVLADAEGLYDKIWCLGDIVGYGPHPNECVDRLNEYDHICIAGNHDWASLGKLDLDDFNPTARFAALWTKDQLTFESRSYLEDLPVLLQEEPEFTLVHGSPRHPIWEYVVHLNIAHINFNHFNTPYCLIGHTHVPVVFIESDDPRRLCQAITPNSAEFIYQLNDKRVIINAGSVGQPRDGDPRASYGLLDMETLTFHIRRIPYPVIEVQSTMQCYNFPPRLWQRLELGY